VDARFAPVTSLETPRLALVAVPREEVARIVAVDLAADEAADHVYFAIRARTGERIVGLVHLRVEPAHRRGGIGYWVAPEHRDHGYATEASAAVVRYAFERLGLNRVTAEVIASNAASQRVATKLGMRIERTRRQHVRRSGAFEDVHLFGILRGEWAQRST
jgi:ribosomal-protein-alanine N-acetyltransferase